jgi:hypothetical protein
MLVVIIHLEIDTSMVRTGDVQIFACINYNTFPGFLSAYTNVCTCKCAPLICRSFGRSAIAPSKRHVNNGTEEIVRA